MYTVKAIDDSYSFDFQRRVDDPNKDLNIVIDQFNKEVEELRLSLETTKKLPVLNQLLNLVWQCEEPTKNFSEIRRISFELNHKITLYFHLSDIRQAPSNNLVNAIPELFEDTRHFFTFLTSAKYIVQLTIREVEKEVASAGPARNENVEFKKAFKTEEHYKYVIDELASVEHGQIFDANGFWVNTEKRKARLAVALLDTLQNKKYFKDEISLTKSSYPEVINKWFGIKIKSPRSGTVAKTHRKEMSQLGFLNHAIKIQA